MASSFGVLELQSCKWVISSRGSKGTNQTGTVVVRKALPACLCKDWQKCRRPSASTRLHRIRNTGSSASVVKFCCGLQGFTGRRKRRLNQPIKSFSLDWWMRYELYDVIVSEFSNNSCCKYVQSGVRPSSFFGEQDLLLCFVLIPSCRTLHT